MTPAATPTSPAASPDPPGRRHEPERGLAYALEIHKRPMIVRSRPAARPPWSHLERRVARVWAVQSMRDALAELVESDSD